MKILYGKEYHRKCEDPLASSLQPSDRDRCVEAVRKFRENRWSPGLNFERLGSGSRRNHWSIRASDELRVILALEPDHMEPQRVALLNMGHHDDMYAWSERQGFHTDLDEHGLVAPHPLPAAQSDAALPPLDFEEWTLYLPKQQWGLVNRHYESGSGVGRIRGAAGTGKTVVALHRALVLGRRYPKERILVTTFSRSLCNHMESRFGRIPDTPCNVDFINVDKLAYHFAPRPLDSKAVDEAFEAAYPRVVPRPDMARLDRRYLQDEVRRVIKGRGAQREEYLDTSRFERLGRGRKHFRRREREISWNLRVEWDREMKALDTVDFPDRLLEARDRARELSSPPYRAAIVDEAQDMTQVGVEFVWALIGGKPGAGLRKDGLMILDDAAQRIYPGGWKPMWAGLKFTNANSDILRVNYRNASRVFNAARAVRGEVDTIQRPQDEGTLDPDRFERPKGDRPILAVVQPRQPGDPGSGESALILERITKLVEEEDFKHDEIGVLVLHNSDADMLVDMFSRQGIPCASLKDLTDGELGEGVRVGTFDRGKGLEFRAVFLPRLGDSRFPLDEDDMQPGQIVMKVADPRAGGAAETEEDLERRRRNLDRLYVAMTRTRDRLYLIADEEPCREIRLARDDGCFEDGRFGAQ